MMLQRLPVRHVHRNLLWTYDGRVWAIWRVDPPQFRHTGTQAQHEVRSRTEALLRSLPAGEALLLSLCPRRHLTELDAALRAGIDADAFPAWGEACDAYRAALEGFDLTGRTHWLALPLPTGTGFVESLRAGFAQLTTGLGVQAAPVAARQVEAATRAADRVASGLPSGWLRPAEPGEIVWMFRRAPLRGPAEPPLTRGEQGASSLDGNVLRGPSLLGLDQVHLDEGSRDGRVLVTPFGRRLLQVRTTSREDASFQVFSVLAEMPAAFAFPGSEYLERMADFPFPVDWAVRLRVVPRDRAEISVRRRARELSEQVTQRSDDQHGVPADLEEAIADTEEYQARLAASASEVEVQAGIVFCTYDADPDLAVEYADILRTEFAPSDYQLVRPVGAQADLYWAMLPGTPVPQVLRDYTQYLLAGGLAMAIPYARTELGDPAGGLLGVRVDASGTAPVLHDPSYAPRVLHASASTGLVGELGAGKSVTQKVLLDMIVRRGGTALAIDRTPSREWARFASIVPGTTRVVDVSAAASFSLDPLRLFPLESAQRYCEGFLALLLGIEGLSAEGAVLSEAIEDVLTGPTPSLAKLASTLAHQDDLRANDLGRRLTAARRLDLAAVVFDERLPPLRVGDTDTLVFTTTGIALPDRDELASDLHMRQLSPEKKIGRAVMYLVAAACRETAFNVDRFAGVFLDECYWLTASAEGERLALELVRDGRKHDCAVYLGAHDPADLGGEVISGLLGQRFLLRHRDTTLAKRGLEWIGLDPDDENLLYLVTRDLSPVDVPETERGQRAGETLYRDCQGRTAVMRVLIPGLPGLDEAIRTDPGQTSDVTEPGGISVGAGS